ncbi:helix-turn-helix domain containing protein [Pectobacterium carotovorum]|uniref:helix-turn-helix domain containing protein n=1 Tax=Pectobacterium carotovorum TaxID=554 RepID=UPI0021C2CFDF|nr:helix-turn-helix domain containing protein [Pectobacterium carotovorum]
MHGVYFVDSNNAAQTASSVLERILSSCGVKIKKGLSDLTSTPTNTINNWVQRNNVPSNAIFMCAVEG